MATKPKRIEDMSEAELNRLSTAAYNKAMPEADTTTGKLKGKSLMDSIEKYNEGARETIAEGEKNTEKYGNAAADEFKKGNYGSAIKEGVKGLGSAAKTMGVDVPVEAFRAGMNRLKNGEKFAKGGSVSSASKRADGCATKGKTRGRLL